MKGKADEGAAAGQAASEAVPLGIEIGYLLAVKPGAARMAETAAKKKPRA